MYNMTEERRAQSGVEVKLEFIIKELDEIKAKLENNYVLIYNIL